MEFLGVWESIYNPKYNYGEFDIIKSQVLNNTKPEGAVVEILLLDAAGKQLHRRLFYAVPPKQLRLANANVKTTVEQVNEGYRITLDCNTLAKNVLLPERQLL